MKMKNNFIFILTNECALFKVDIEK